MVPTYVFYILCFQLDYKILSSKAWQADGTPNTLSRLYYNHVYFCCQKFALVLVRTSVPAAAAFFSSLEFSTLAEWGSGSVASKGKCWSWLADLWPGASHLHRGRNLSMTVDFLSTADILRPALCCFMLCLFCPQAVRHKCY